MKTIDTLVDDIYGLFDNNELEISEEKATRFGVNLAKIIKTRLEASEREPALSMSNVGKPCNRQLWYEINTPEKAETLPAKAKLKFLYGDILEELVLFLAEEAGHSVEGQQDTLEVEGLQGHRDAIIDGTTVDVKSASKYSFNKFREGNLQDNDGFGYIPQLNGYILGGADDPLVKDKENGYFLVIGKELGDICIDKHTLDKDKYLKDLEETRLAVNAPTPPNRAFTDEADGKSGNRKLGFQCSYCPFKHECWSGLRTFIYSTGPRYLTKVARTPDVTEIK